MPSRYVFLGTSLALMLQTNYRFAGPLGIGELLAITYFILVFLNNFFSAQWLKAQKPDNQTIFFVAVLILIITPITLWSSSMNVVGSSIRDLISYYFVAFFLLALPNTEKDIQTMVKSFLIVLFITIVFQYFWGGSLSYYYARFTGGAKNPNQLALYLVAAIFLSAYLPSNVTRVVVIILSLFFGIITSSDAYFVFLFTSLIAFITLVIVPPRAVVFMLPMLITLSFMALSFTSLTEPLLLRWESADEGGSRTQLYISAIYAWLDTPFSSIFGHGAGNFSGFTGPFGNAEAHNTVLDLASIAGIFGLLLFPVIPLWTAMNSLTKNYRFAPALFVGLVAFAFFHFVARQPVFWVSLILFSRTLQTGWAMQKSKTVPGFIFKEGNT